MKVLNNYFKWVLLVAVVGIFISCSDKNSPTGPEEQDTDVVTEYWTQVPSEVSEPDSTSMNPPLDIVSSSHSAPTGELIVNGSFETGNFAGWQIATTGSPFSPWRVTGSGFRTYNRLPTTQPQDGNRLAVNGFDGSGPMEYRLWQTVTIPPSGMLSWKYRAQWLYANLGGFASQPRLFQVQLRDVSNGNILATVHNFSTGTQSQNPSGNTGFVSASADLSSFGGQTVDIYFIMNIPQSSTGPGMFEIDDISLQGVVGNNVFVSDSNVDTWDPIAFTQANPASWASFCTDTPAVGLDANWTNPHKATQFPNGTATFEGLVDIDANWINAWPNISSGGSGVGAQNWTRYSTTVSGEGDYVIQFVADNCSWIYIDGEIVGNQTTNITDGKYPITLPGGDVELQFIILDGGGEAGGMFRLETLESFIDNGGDEDDLVINNAPVADAGADQSLNATGTQTHVTLDGSGSSDSDGDALTYSWSLNGSEIATGGSPTVNLPRGSHTITLTVADPDGATDSDDVVVEVLNNAPTANAGADQSINAVSTLTSVTLDGSGSSDPDGDPLTYSWSLNGSEIATGVSPTVELGLGVHTITLTVNCPSGDSDTDEVVVEIYNNAPTANAGADQAVNATNPLTSISLNGSGSSDPDGNPLTYSWSLSGSEIATGAAPTVELGVGTHTITLTVADPLGDTNSDEVVVEVINNPPVADAAANQTIEATGVLTTASLNGSGSSDPNGDAITYSWSIGGSEVATGANPAIELALGSHTVTLTVTDEYGATATDEVVIEVVDTTAPELSYNVLDTSLWPPNHKMRKVISGVNITDIADPNAAVDITVTSNEAINGQGDGNTDADWEVRGGDVYVRAERSGKGNGRIYTITITGSDASGNETVESVEVTVPHDQGKGKGKKK